MAESDRSESAVPEFLTVYDVASALQVNQMTVRNWIDRGELPATRVGPRRVRIRRSDFDAFVASQATAPQAAQQLASALQDALAATEAQAVDRMVAALNTLADASRALAAELDRRRQA